jgi:hypothetical protein
MESLIVAILAGVAMWFAINQGRKRRARRAAVAAQAAQPPSAGTMPRLGTPGTISRQQIKALEANNFEPSTDWSREEAALMLDGLAYARGVLAAVTGRHDHDIDVQNQVFAFVMRDDVIREYVRAEQPAEPLPRDASFEQVAAFVRRTVG